LIIKKLIKRKLKMKKSKIKHRVIIPGNPKRNREDLVKSELEYSDYSELEEKSSSIEKEDKSLIKKRNTKNDDDGDGEQIKLHNSSKIKDSNKILVLSEETSYGNYSNDSKKKNNNKNNNYIIYMYGISNGFTRNPFIYR
jgi:hypothetical protein